MRTNDALKNRPNTRPLWLLAAAALLAGCGGYDAEYDCEQTIACAKEMNETPPDLELCVDVTEAILDNATDAQKDALDDIWDECKDEKSCDFLDCATEYVD